MTQFGMGDPLRPWVKSIDDYWPYLKEEKESQPVYEDFSLSLTDNESAPVNEAASTQTQAEEAAKQEKPAINKKLILAAGALLYFFMR